MGPRPSRRPRRREGRALDEVPTLSAQASSTMRASSMVPRRLLRRTCCPQHSPQEGMAAETPRFPVWISSRHCTVGSSLCPCAHMCASQQRHKHEALAMQLLCLYASSGASGLPIQQRHYILLYSNIPSCTTSYTSTSIHAGHIGYASAAVLTASACSPDAARPLSLACSSCSSCFEAISSASRRSSASA